MLATTSTLIMYRKSKDDSSVGVIFAGNTVLHTIERPLIEGPKWRGGKPFASCVPFGLYKLIPHSSSKYGNVWALVNPELGVYHYKAERMQETDRYGILIHAANWVRQLSGCIAVGLGASYSISLNEYMVSNSLLGMQRLTTAMHENKYTHLEILAYEIAY